MLQSLSKYSFYAVLLGQRLGSFRWDLLFCWPVTVNVAQYAAVLHYIHLSAKVEIGHFSYSCQCYWVQFRCLLTTRGMWLSCFLTTQLQVYELGRCVGAVPLIHPRIVVQIIIHSRVQPFIKNTGGQLAVGHHTLVKTQ